MRLGECNVSISYIMMVIIRNIERILRTEATQEVAASIPLVRIAGLPEEVANFMSMLNRHGVYDRGELFGYENVG